MRPLALVLLLLAACSQSSSSGPATTSTADNCKSQYSPTKGYGYASDGPYATAPADDAGVPATPPDAVDLAVKSCAGSADAAACDRESLMTRDAALCLAKASGLVAGISPWTATIVFHAKHRRIVWNVTATTASDSASGSSGGDVMTIDAINGAVLGTSQWGATPLARDGARIRPNEVRGARALYVDRHLPLEAEALCEWAAVELCHGARFGRAFRNGAGQGFDVFVVAEHVDVRSRRERDTCRGERPTGNLSCSVGHASAYQRAPRTAPASLAPSRSATSRVVSDSSVSHATPSAPNRA